MTLFFRLVEDDVEQKASKLRALIHGFRGGAAASPQMFDVESLDFTEVTGSPFSYWVSSGVRATFRHPRFEQQEKRTAKQGLSTTDDFRFVRLWWEVSPAGTRTRWFPFAKGGAFSLGYAPIYLVVSWFEGGHEMYAFTGITDGTSSAPMRSPHFYFRAGLTWPLRTQSGFGMRAMPANCVFGHKGPACFVANDAPDELLALLGVTMSSVFRYLVDLQTAFGAYEVGVIQRTPVPKLSVNDRSALAKLARRAWSLKHRMDNTNEASHAFILPPGVIRYEGAASDASVSGFNRDAVERELTEIQREIDDLAFRLYSIGDEDRATIAGSSKFTSGRVQETDSDDAVEQGDQDDDSVEATMGSSQLPMLSWLVGVTFGRFDPRPAARECAIPPEPEPFDPLPSRSPGMRQEGGGTADAPAILVDDGGHPGDIVVRARAVAEKIGWSVPDDLRRWLSREFFPLHIKMYSKSRRKAPIYWQLATPTASYSVWLYIHAFTDDTNFRVQNDYVTPKLAHEERCLEAMAREQATATERKALAEQRAFVEELRAFLDEVKRVAPLWKPNLDDGVIINFAPLWRLVPQHKAWQKELKATWDTLCDGAYDWAHLAMHLWPERVVPKCATDRSLAIAHGLEDVFWVEGSDGKWSARKAPARPIEELVRERTSSAVKAALKSLLEAPVAAGGSKKARKGKPHA